MYVSPSSYIQLANKKTGQHADERSSLSKVPETFEKLKKEKGPLGAVRAIVGLLMTPS